MTSTIAASVIVNTYNRADYLTRLLASLQHLTGPAFEVVVVNGPSTDDTDRVLERYAGRIKVASCVAANLAQSRNIGIAVSSGDIVLFIDDDALPADAHWVSRYVDGFARPGAERLAALGGPVWHRDTMAKEFDGGLTSDYAFQIFTRGGAESIAPARPGEWFPRVAGGNCAFRRQTLIDIGGFDEYYSYYLEEADVCVRLMRAGYQVGHLSDAGIRHYPALSERRTSKYDRNWHVIARSDGYYCMRHGSNSPPMRLIRTLGYAWRKHHFREIASYFVRGEIGPAHTTRLLAQWSGGFLRGLGAGATATTRLHPLQTHATTPVPFQLAPRSPGLRIAMLTQTIPGQPGAGGIGRYSYDLAVGLHERGHQVHIICKDERRRVHQSPGFEVTGIPAVEYQPHEFSANRPVVNKNLSYALAVLRTLQRLHAAGETFDLLHASNWDAEGLAVIRSAALPTVLMLVSPLAQVIETEGWELDEDLKAAVALDRWQIDHADTVAIPSRGVLSSYERLMGLKAGDAERFHLLPLGIQLDLRTTNGSRTDVSRTGRYRLLYVGRFERRKGIHLLLDLLPDLLTRFPEWDCHLVGDCDGVESDGLSWRTRFERRHQGRPWLSRVVFHGIVSEDALAQHYRACDVFVAPSLFESFGLIYQEAMQYGKPVVGCRTGGVPEVVRDEVEGLLVEPGDRDGLVVALTRLMSDPELRAQLGDRGRQRVREEQHHRTMAAAAEEIYQQTLAASRESGRRALGRWPTAIPIFTPDGAVVRTSGWQRVDSGGMPYLMANTPGSRLEFFVAAGRALRLVLLRHEWSGVAEISVGGERRALLNLYRSGAMEAGFTTWVPLDRPSSSVPSDMTTPGVPVAIQVHRERHPQSRGHEVWINEILSVPDNLASVREDEERRHR